MNSSESDNNGDSISEGIPGVGGSGISSREYVSTIERQLADVDNIWGLIQDPKNVVIIGRFKNSRHSGEISLTQRDKLTVTLAVAIKKDGDDVLTGNPLFDTPIYDTTKYASWDQYVGTNNNCVRMLEEDLVYYVDPNVHAQASNLAGGSEIYIYQTQNGIDNFHASARILDLDSQILLLLNYTTQSQLH